METQAEMSERKRKFVEVYSSLARRKRVEAVDLSEQLRYIEKTQKSGLEVDENVINQIKENLGKSRNTYDLAHKRVEILIGNGIDEGFNYDATDIENRRRIREIEQGGCTVHPRTYNDPVGEKLWDLGARNGAVYWNNWKPKFAHSFVAAEMLDKMENRTMTEQEYEHIANSTPRQLKREWRKRKAA